MKIKIGDKHGMLIVIGKEKNIGDCTGWKVKCDCGVEKILSSKNFLRAKSCGCIKSKVSKKNCEDRTISFWDRMKKVGDCLEWSGSRDKDGYGTLRRGKIDHKAHRVAYELKNGQIPKGMCVCHTCDNPPCCNPDHLFLGTIKENNRDRTSKGRTAMGEKNGLSKLKDEDIIKIRKMHTMGISQQKIADIFGVFQTSISRICRCVSWKHIK